MEIENTKEVYFHEYCPKCVHKDVDETEDPCNECMTHFYMINSHKPYNFKEKQ